MAYSLQPKSSGKIDCTEKPVSGVNNTFYDWVVKFENQDSDPLPEDIPFVKCDQYKYYYMKVGDLQVQENVTALGKVLASEVYSGGGVHRLSAKKNFDIPHPTKKGWRLRHTCLEGPENGVYFRGKIKEESYITLPEYWGGLVDPESITVQLTSIGHYQELFYEIVEWGTKIKVSNNAGSSINCSYLVHGERKDGEKLIVEYEGDSPADYPGDDSQYSVVGWNYDVRS
jgi:hypothetical protein